MYPLTNTGSSLQSVDGVSLVDAGRIKVHAGQLEPEPVRDYNILRRETLMENLEREKEKEREREREREREEAFKPSICNLIA